MSANVFVLVASALASAVEFVEAFTVVLAVGVTRGWRSSLVGAIAALVILAIIIVIFGVAILRLFPLGALRTAVGVFLLLFGLQWLKKAVLRYSGLKAQRNEANEFEHEVEVLRGVSGSRSGIDWPGATASFNGVFLEMLEVTLIVLALGSGARAMGSAVIGAVVAAAFVAVVGYLLRRPLERVPENTLKFVVGIMLTTFGTFWAGEGVGISWWRGDLVILPLLAVYLVASWILVLALSRGRAEVPSSLRQAGS
ncbi:MAG TPA: hypothetical protein VFB58_02465 [Chloroflexota bacterium]|nr:hypothetical protein [Chloroflexota bacterium]